jgi:CubicO group peptidase (beta-lactamase class C family)
MVLAAALAAATAAQAQEPIPPAGVEDVFARFKPDDPGCAVGVEMPGKAPLLRGFGSADLEHGVPITPDTVFEAGSVSKQFTAAAVLLLAAEGKLALSDDIRKYLPEMPDYGRPITVDMLLSHTSGLRDWGEVAALAGWPRTTRVYTSSEVLLIAARQKSLNYPPGEAYSYTYTGYNLAGLIVQRVSGQSLAEFTKARLFQPLGMTHTSWRDNFRRVVKDRAIAYEAGPNGSWLQEMPFENTYGHGALLTTVGDLLAWNRALTEGRLGAGIAEKMAERPTLTGGRRISYARGLMVLSSDGREEVSHSGATAAYRAWLARLPASGVSVALLCNRADVNPTQVGHRVINGVIVRPVVRPVTRLAPEADLARIPGAYVDERTGQVLRVVAEKGELRLRGGGAFQAQAEAGRYLGGGMDFTFAGDVAKRLDPAGETITYARKAEVRPTPAELAAIAGAYSSPEAGAVLVASVTKTGALVISPADRPSESNGLAPLYKDAFQGDGNLIRVVRDAKGKVAALRFTSGRVYALDFRRVDAR